MAGTQPQFYLDSKSTWKAMLTDIASARRTIDIERYIFVCDEIGRRFIDALITKAKEGVRVRILCDMVGSYSFYRSTIPEELQRVGIEVAFFNPINIWRLGNFTSNFFRDHRKILTIDSAIGYMGGVGIQDMFADWRDTEVRIEGPLVAQMEQSFSRIWRAASQRRFLRFRRPDLFVKNFGVVTNSPHFGQRFLYRALIDAIRSAKHTLYLTTPYFIPDIRMLRVIRLAAKRGVDVRLLVPSYADHYMITSARQSYFTLLLNAGIKIYRYQGTMLHAKTVTIDGEWGTVGSFNLDNLSFLFNYEANIVSTDKNFVESLQAHFLQDIKQAEKVEYETWIKRPLVQKIQEALTWPFHDIL